MKEGISELDTAIVGNPLFHSTFSSPLKIDPSLSKRATGFLELSAVNAYYLAEPARGVRLAPSNRREKSDPLVSGQNSVPIAGNSVDHNQLHFLLGNCEQPGQDRTVAPGSTLTSQPVSPL